MPKKIDFAKGNKASGKAHSPIKDRARKPGKGQASYDGGDHEKKDREKKPTSSGKNPFDDFGKPTGGVGKSTGSDDNNVFSDIKKMSGGKRSKDGCLPKFMMLLLSIAAGAAYVFLGS